MLGTGSRAHGAQGCAQDLLYQKVWKSRNLQSPKGVSH